MPLTRVLAPLDELTRDPARSEIQPRPLIIQLDAQTLRSGVHVSSPGVEAGGAVVVTLECGPGGVIFKVVDSGMGIAPGLGLVHVKEIVERLGGRIDVDSPSSTGTTFTITLPNARWAPLASPILPSDADSAFLHKVDALIAGQLGNPAFDIQTLCTRLHLSAKQTQRKLRVLTGLTPMEYLRQTRLRRAEELLLQGESVSRVAYSTGFSSQSYFTTSFKKWAGETPRSWQRRKLKSRDL